MFSLINIVAPVFAIVAFGYLAVRLKVYPSSGVAGLLTFVNKFATPLLLFRAMLNVDFQTAFNPALIVPFFVSAFIVFALGILGGRVLFKRRPGESVVTGMVALFSNTVLLGLPILQRAYGEPALVIAFTLIGLHAAILLTTAVVTMEIVRSDGKSAGAATVQVVTSIFKNPLLIGGGLGFIGNIAGLNLPVVVEEFLEIMIQAIVPVALFGLGGALNSYSLRENWPEAVFTSFVKLIIQPLIVWVILVPILRVDPQIARYVVLMAAMPTGINAYIFATYYNRSADVAANGVLISTIAAVFTISMWLVFLG